MTDQPTIEIRPEQPYAARRVVMPMSDFDTAIPALMEEVGAWLGGRGVEPAGPPLLRYRVIDMPERMDVEIGFPVAAPVEGDGTVLADVLPEGRYATLVYTGAKNGVAANKRLIEWIEGQGEDVVHHPSENGEAFKARYESFLTDSKAEPDQDKWRTQVSIKLRD